VEWQKDYLADVLGPVRSTLIYFIAEGGVDQQAGGFEASSKVPQNHLSKNKKHRSSWDWFIDSIPKDIMPNS